ncbi:MAG: TM0106 family RecB-like putative nuclease [Bacteroidales bacterium]|nr:TM0106 family RecB-like putative nuclease [Bacteroidales bacterium]
MSFNNEIIYALIECDYKGFLKYSGRHEEKKDYELYFENKKQEYKRKFKEKHQAQCFKGIFNISEYSINDIIRDVYFSINDFNILIDFIKIDENKLRKSLIAVPIFVFPQERLSQREKLFLSFIISYLTKRVSYIANYVLGVYGKEQKQTKIHSKEHKPEHNRLLGKIDNIQKLELFRNRKCPECGYNQYCLKIAQEQDLLSLVSGITKNDIKKKNEKGIFTLTQMSYTFRPRRNRAKRKAINKKRKIELQALTLREGKVHIYEYPELTAGQIEIYVDIEGLPYENYYYLIGIIVRCENKIEYKRFWANSSSEEFELFRNFIDFTSTYNDFIMYHYGQYEIKALNKYKAKLNLKYQKQLDKIFINAVDILGTIRASVYFPIYSYSLKDVAKYIGFNWSNPKASGLQSIVWRKKWEETQNEKYKVELLTYNAEDCKALVIVKDYILKIVSPDDNSVKPESLIKKQFSFRFKANQYSLPEIEVVHNHSSFDYQKEHAIVKSNHVSKKRVLGKIKRRKYPYNTIIKKKSIKCPKCKSNSYRTNSTLKKKVIDLQIRDVGIKRWVIQYQTNKYNCKNCKKTYIPQTYLDFKYKYGHFIMCYTIHQHIVNNESFRQIANNLKEFFDLEIGLTSLKDFKIRFSEYYYNTFKALKKRVITSEVIYVDETPINMKFENGYIWVLSNGFDVVCFYQPNREAKFIWDLLKDFKGVLVSDFYSAYDGIDCIHQKCLLHLIRDLNDDLIRSPFNKELKCITESFSSLMECIVKTIDKKGFSKQFLAKHISEARYFINTLQQKDFKSDIAIKYQKRFHKYRDRLFTFLHYDNLSWHNNTVEFAIKQLALHRNSNQNFFSSSRINDYLIAMSIYITCKYHNISFLKFLISKSKTIKAHNNTKT